MVSHYLMLIEMSGVKPKFYHDSKRVSVSYFVARPVTVAHRNQTFDFYISMMSRPVVTLSNIQSRWPITVIIIYESNCCDISAQDSLS